MDAQTEERVQRALAICRDRLHADDDTEDEVKTLVMNIRLPFEPEHVELIEQFAGAAGQNSAEFMTELCASHLEAIMMLLLRDLKRLQQIVN